MTIRRYLFLLVSGLLLTVALLQVSLIIYFKSNIEDEVERRGKQVADKLINIAIESYGEDLTAMDQSSLNEQRLSNPKTNILIEIHKRKEVRPVYIFDVPRKALTRKNKLNQLLKSLPKEMKLETMALASDFAQLDVRQLKSNYKGYSIEISAKPNVPKRLIKKHLKRQIAKIYNLDTSNGTFEQTMTVLSSDGTSSLVTQKPDSGTTEDSVTNIEKEIRLENAITSSFPFLKPNQRKDKHIINKMTYYMISIIVLSTLLGFVLIYLFGNRFSQPLQNLVAGFKKLEQGNSGINVPEEGVEEVKATIERFNKMSLKLEELAEAEKQMQQQQHLTEISDISKGIAHALRNPLHTIGLAVEQLESDSVKPELKNKLIGRVKNKIIQLDKSIKALLTITTGEIDRQESVSISAVINDVVLELRQSHDSKDGNLVVEQDLDNTLTIKGSNNEIRTIIHTLIYNAYEASLLNSSREESSKIVIEIRSVRETDLAVICINDHGSGLDSEIEKTLFQPHVSSKAEGAGMGLYISKRIAEIYYHGALTLENSITKAEVSGALAVCKLKSVKEG